MKRLEAFIAIAMILIEVGYFYPTTMVIVEMDEMKDSFTVETSTGYQYEVDGVEDFLLGDYVSALMFSKGTWYIADDEVLVVRYAGWNMYTIRPWEGGEQGW